ncbi:hypothetical protein [Thalassobellus suaedae]|uniref:Uncharacterized protein n=1 Tax=Thalassobellus suaedae TaxID=3074124 RepID=A0ABY9XWH2_9FLAO|nr:hypothetical protein RHP51_05145 [Flavobacteriaceae bacterium HL-DH14]
MKTNETVLAYLDALKELKTILEETEKVPLRKFFESKKLNQRTGTIMVNGGLIKNLGSRGISARYVWNTIEPNYKMAEELIKRANEAVNDYKKNKRKDSKLNRKKKAKVETVTKYQEAIIKLHHILQYTTRINMRDFLVKNHLSFKIGKVIQDLQIIENISKSKRGPEYKWIAGEPTYEMAKMILEKVNIRTDIHLPKPKKIKKSDKVNYTETKLLFGLITIRTKHFYHN